jgi:hypothetical protein
MSSQDVKDVTVVTQSKKSAILVKKVLWVSRHSFCSDKKRAIERVVLQTLKPYEKEKNIHIEVLQMPDRFSSAKSAYNTIMHECLVEDIDILCVVLPVDMLAYLLYQTRKENLMILQWHGKKIIRTKKSQGWKKQCVEGHWRQTTISISAVPVGLADGK